jgi:two-component system response regulator LytT
MNVLIIEDEYGAAKNLRAVLKEIDRAIQVLAVIETVRDAVRWIQNNPSPDLAFFDIKLADGNSFEIFEKINIEFPVVFTTAYNEYAIQAFKVNSIDYILKPIQKEALEFALDKYQRIYPNNETPNSENLSKLISELGLLTKKRSRKTFLIHYQDRLLPVSVSDFAYIFIRNGIVYGMTFRKEKYVIDQKLDQIEEQIDPDEFFRINRQTIVSRKAIQEAVHYFNGRLKLKVMPPPQDDMLVSKAKASAFKNWLGG